MKNGHSLKKTAQTALMAAVICVCAWITVPTAIPFTMQTFGVFLALMLLGGKYGTLAVTVYILLGAVGLPVFSGFQGGVGVLLGPTGGYILGFLLCGLIYWATERRWRRENRTANRWLFDGALVIGLCLCYVFGSFWYALICLRGGSAVSFLAALNLCVVPFVVPDLLKLVLADFVYRKLTDRLRRVGEKQTRKDEEQP